MSRNLSADVPVSEVLLTEDRGMIARQGVLDWSGGAGVVIIDEVAPVLVDASLQVACDAGAVGRVAVRRYWAGQDTSALAASARLRRETVSQLSAESVRRRSQRERAEGLLSTLSAGISAAASAGIGEASQWAADLAAVHDRLLARGDAEQDALAQQAEAAEALAKIAAAIESASAKWRLRARVEVALDAPAGPVTLTLRYLVPAAMWRPAYRASLVDDVVTLSAQATIWQRTGEDWPAVPVALSTARPSTGATLPPLYTDQLSLRDKTAQERKVIQARSFQQSIQKASLTDDDAGLPGVDDGGEARHLTTARPIAVPSTGRPHRALVAAAEASAQVRYRCIPELMRLVFREVALVNPLPHPLLAGPVTLIADGGTCGIGEIPFVASGERFPLSFGSEDNISVRYERTAEIEDRFAVSDYRWLLQRAELTNTGASAVSVELLLRVPVSELAQVKVVLDRDKRSDSDMDGPDEQGFVRFVVSLPPGQSVSRRVAFRVEKASNVRLEDFW